MANHLGSESYVEESGQVNECRGWAIFQNFSPRDTEYTQETLELSRSGSCPNLSGYLISRGLFLWEVEAFFANSAIRLSPYNHGVRVRHFRRRPCRIASRLYSSVAPSCSC